MKLSADNLKPAIPCIEYQSQNSGKFPFLQTNIGRQTQNTTLKIYLDNMAAHTLYGQSGSQTLALGSVPLGFK
jgi:hypothetical protein